MSLFSLKVNNDDKNNNLFKSQLLKNFNSLKLAPCFPHKNTALGKTPQVSWPDPLGIHMAMVEEAEYQKAYLMDL